MKIFSSILEENQLRFSYGEQLLDSTALGFKNISGITKVVGGDGADILVLSTDNKTVKSIEGGKGNDEIDGNGESNIISGGDGDDVIRTFGGSDNIIAGIGKDQIDAGTGNDVIFGGEGNDTYIFRDAWGADIITETNQNEQNIFDFSSYWTSINN